MRRLLVLVFLAFGLFVVSASADEPSMELRWHLDEIHDFGESLGVFDSSGRNRAADVSGDVRPVAGRFAGGVGFGAGGLISTPAPPALENGFLTLTTWVRAPSNPNADGTGPQRILGLGGDSDCNKFAYALTLDPSGSVTFDVRDDNNEIIKSKALRPLQLWDGFWHSVIAEVSGAKIYLFIDGEYYGDPGTPIAAPVDYADNSGPFAAGGCPAGGQSYTGELDEVRAYSTDLGPGETAWLGHPPQGAPAPVLPVPPSSYLPIDVSARLPLDQIDSDATTPDISGQNNKGKNVEATITPGKYGNALDFSTSGTSSGFLIDDDEYLHPQEFTVSTWLKYTRGVNDHSRTIVGKGAGAAGLNCSSHSWALRNAAGDGTSDNPTTGLQFYVNVFTHDGGQTMVTPPILPYGQVYDGTWHAVAASYANGTAKLYLDGVLKGTADVPASAIGPSGVPEEVDYGPRYFYDWIGVGRYPDPDCALAGFRFPGALDDLRIYDRELTPGEIAAIHGSSSPRRTRP